MRQRIANTIARNCEIVNLRRLERDRENARLRDCEPIELFALCDEGKEARERIES